MTTPQPTVIGVDLSSKPDTTSVSLHLAGRTYPAVALSIQQPWAWLIVNGFKNIENRSWRTKRRGPVFIHTGRKIDRAAHDLVRVGIHPVTGERSLEGNNYPATWNEAVPTGGIVGFAVISDCVDHHASPWFVGDFGFVLTHATPIEFMPCKGALGFFRPQFGSAPNV